jgi:hypothetical protein
LKGKRDRVKGGMVMEVRDYCTNVSAELAGWKAKMYDVVNKLDHVSTGAKEKVVPEVNELHMIIDELGDRIARLGRECSTNWKPERGQDHEVIWPKQFGETWDSISQSDIGG